MWLNKEGLWNWMSLKHICLKIEDSWQKLRPEVSPGHVICEVVCLWVRVWSGESGLRVSALGRLTSKQMVRWKNLTLSSSLLSLSFWFAGWPALGRTDSGSHGVGCKHDHSGMLFHPGTVHGAGVPRAHRQSGTREALSSCHPEALPAVDRKAGSWENSSQCLF